MARLQNDTEFIRPSEEFPPPAEQYTPLPPEFGGGGEDAPSRKRKRKYHWLAAALAAGLLSTVAMFGDTEQAISEPLASPSPQAVAAASTLTPAASPSSALDLTPLLSPGLPDASTPAPSAAPTATPAPTLAPDVQLTFYRTSEVYHGMVVLQAQDRMEAVVIRIWDPALQETVWEYTLSDDEVAQGMYRFENIDLAATEYGRKHFDLLMQGYEPDLILEAVCTVRTDGGTETITKQAEAADEPLSSVSYDLRDP